MSRSEHTRRTFPAASPRRRAGVSLLETVGVVGVTMVVLSTTSVAIFRVSQLNHRFKNVGVEQANRHRTFQELREKIHAAERVDVVSPRIVRLAAAHWPADVEWDLEHLPVLSHWNFDIPARWRIQDGMLQILDDRPGVASPAILFEAAVGIASPRRLEPPTPLPPSSPLPPLEALP